MKEQILSQIVRRVSSQSALPSIDECMTIADMVHAGFDWPKGTVPRPDLHMVRMLRMAALLEVLGSWYESAADEPEWVGGPFQAFNRLQMTDQAIDIDHMDALLADPDPAHPQRLSGHLLILDEEEFNAVSSGLDAISDNLDDEARHMAGTPRADGINRTLDAIGRLTERMNGIGKAFSRKADPDCK